MHLPLFCLFLLIGKALSAGTYCVSLPNTLPQGASCGNGINCQYGLYCNRNALCTPLVTAGGSCVHNSDCARGTTCKGPAPSFYDLSTTQCIANASPGQSCSLATTVTTPSCGTQVCTSGRCVAGGVGDSCILASDCLSNICNNLLCGNVTDGSSCASNSVCSPLSYCTTGKVCSPKLTFGVCVSSANCAYGYGCIGVSSSDQTQCTQYSTKSSGQYCGSNSDAAMFCQNPQRCTNGYCASKDADLCSSNGGCAANEACTCEERVLVQGFGVCTSNPCFSLYSSYQQCMSQNCPSTPLIEYSGSCRSRLCSTQYQQYLQCSGASSIFVPFAFVIFFAMLTSWIKL